MAYKYIHKRGAGWVVVNRSGKTLSRHATRAKAIASFRAMEASKHGAKMRNRKKR